MTVETLHVLSDILERNLWNHVADAPPDPMLVKSICAEAAQMIISRECMLHHGTDQRFVVAYVLGNGELTSKIDSIGGKARIGQSLLWEKFEIIDKFEKDLLAFAGFSQ